MKPHCSLTAFLAALLLAGMAYAKPADEASKNIASAYRDMDRAYVKADYKTIEKYFSPECTFKRIGEPGLIKTPVFLKGLEAMSNIRVVVSSSSKVTSTKKAGEDIQASVFWAQASEPKGPGKKMSVSAGSKSAHQTLKDTWRKVGGNWVIVRRLIGE